MTALLDAASGAGATGTAAALREAPPVRRLAVAAGAPRRALIMVDAMDGAGSTGPRNGAHEAGGGEYFSRRKTAQ